MTLTWIDPLQDPRWGPFLALRREASVFHTAAWLDALRRTYGYRPVVFTTAAAGQPLCNALLFCRVSSWVTGRRLVSLPFSDHCDPLVDSSDELRAMLTSLKQLGGPELGRYVEVRPRRWAYQVDGFKAESVFCLHTLDLVRPLDAIFRSFHKSCVQRAIRRAEREGVSCECGTNDRLLTDFYTLHGLTRRRHHAPLQPIAWFRNLTGCFGDRCRIYAARHRGRLIAALFILGHRGTAVYKYSCLDPRYKTLGAVPFLLWKAIGDAQQSGATEFDLGRTDTDNGGLLAFKDHLGARREPLTYFRYEPNGTGRLMDHYPALARRAYALVPPGLRERIAGRFYGHFA